MRKNLFVSILFIGAVCSCKREPDYSKTLQEYYDFGLPKIERKWSYEEVEVSIKLLGRLKEKDSFPLPKLDSKKSGQYIKKMISALPRITFGDSLSYKRKARDFNFLQKMIGRLAPLYGISEKEQAYYSNELIEFNKLTLEELAKMTLLFYEGNADESMTYVDHRKNNSAQFQRGLHGILEASLKNHESDMNYKEADKIELAETFSKNIAPIWHYLEKESREKLTTQLRTIAEQNEIGKVRRIYSNFLENIASEIQ